MTIGLHQNLSGSKSEFEPIVSKIRLKTLEAIRAYEERGAGTSLHYRVYKALGQGPGTTTEIQERLPFRDRPSIMSLSMILRTSSWATFDASTRTNREHGRQTTWSLKE